LSTLGNTAFLVIGGDGLIGNALAHRLKQENCEVVATTRRLVTTETSELFLDLTEKFEEFLKNKKISHLVERGPLTAVLAAAMTRIADCAMDEPRSRLVNMTMTVDLGRKLLANGIDVVFLSSNAVFSGEIAYPTEYTVPDPSTTYGNQKAEAEHELLSFHAKMANPPRLKIVRLTKVLHKSLPLIERWISDLRLGKTISAFQDRPFSPISLQYAVNELARIATLGSSGIYHLSGNPDLSYCEFAKLLAAKLGVSLDLVQAELALFGSGLMQHYSALGATSVGCDLSIEPESPDAVIRNLLKQ